MSGVPNGKAPGLIIARRMLRDHGHRDPIKNALHRLAKEKKIERLGHGIYLLPKYHPRFGKLNPSLENIAAAIAEHDHVRIKPTGASALNKLGLSTRYMDCWLMLVPPICKEPEKLPHR